MTGPGQAGQTRASCTAAASTRKLPLIFIHPSDAFKIGSRVPARFEAGSLAPFALREPPDLLRAASHKR